MTPSRAWAGRVTPSRFAAWSGDSYAGLDRFGRIVDQRWRKTSDGSHTDRFAYGYDRNGNRQ